LLTAGGDFPPLIYHSACIVVTIATKIQNGVNVDQLVGTVNAVKATPDLAKFKFR